MYIAVVGRRLRPGVSADDFLRAWYPDRGFGVPGRGPILARDVADDREILTMAIVDLPDRASLAEAMERVAAREAARHDRIDALVESSRVHALYEVLAEYDFYSDETVEAGRPASTGGHGEPPLPRA
jgi:hypothetical protein